MPALSDLYGLRLTPDFPDAPPAFDLELLRWHLGENGEESQESDT